MTNTNQLELIDDTFYTDKTEYGTWRSYDKDGHVLIISGTEEQCVAATRFYLKGKQEGWDSLACTTYSGEVGGKL